jgi:hypothetical protein
VIRYIFARHNLLEEARERKLNYVGFQASPEGYEKKSSCYDVAGLDSPYFGYIVGKMSVLILMEGQGILVVIETNVYHKYVFTKTSFATSSCGNGCAEGRRETERATVLGRPITTMMTD